MMNEFGEQLFEKLAFFHSRKQNKQTLINTAENNELNID